MVVSFERPDGGIFSWQSMDIKDFHGGREGWTPVLLTRIFPRECRKGDIMKIYLWNMGSGPVLIDEMRTHILQYTF